VTDNNTNARLRVAMIERADAWLNFNRKSVTWRILNELRDELVRNSAGDSRPLTADREGLADVLARAMADAYDPGLEKAVADALFASGVVRPVADVQAEAWDEGFDAGEADVMNHNKAGWDGDCIPNPYRTPASPEEGKD